MPRTVRLLPIVLIVGVLAISVSGKEKIAPGELFPSVKPFNAGFLKVDDLHEIFFAQFGNPKGKPVIVLHGGPGVGSYPRLTQYFDPAKFMILLHDQRGAGQSKPAGEIRNNTTQYLVSDIVKLREHLGIKGKTLVFGGSWGSTLALAYAEEHPELVSGLVLRGVFTASTEEPLNGFVGPMPRTFFPDSAAEVDAALPSSMKSFTPQAMLELLNGNDTKAKKHATAAWIRSAVKCGKLHATDEEVNRNWDEYDLVPGARIDCHYAVNDFFLPDDQLLRNTDGIKDIPATIINGRYDITCPPITAWRLHKKLPKSKLVIVEEAGHSESEPGITKALLEAVAEFE